MSEDEREKFDENGDYSEEQAPWTPQGPLSNLRQTLSSIPPLLRWGLLGVFLLSFLPWFLSSKEGPVEQNLELANQMTDSSMSDTETSTPAANQSLAAEENKEPPLAESRTETADAGKAGNSKAVPASDSPPISSQTNQYFSQINGLYPIPIFISSDTQNNTWLSTVEEIVRISGQQVEQAVRVEELNSEIFDQAFDRDLSPISASFLDGQDNLWVGGQDGQLLQHQGTEWKILLDSGQPIKGQIWSMVRDGNNLFIGQLNGLWRWDIAKSKLHRYSDFQGTSINSFYAHPTLGLLMASSKGLWNYRNEGWVQLYTEDSVQSEFSCLSVQANGRILIGSKNGLLQISPEGEKLEHSLKGVDVLSIALSPTGDLFVGSRQNGLFWRNKKGSWFNVHNKVGLPANLVSRIHLDKRGNIWLGLGGQGIFYSALVKAQKFLEEHPYIEAEPEGPEQFEFANACRAAEKQLSGDPLSSEIRKLVVDAETFVFFRGKQVCPLGKGYLRVDGAAALASADSLLIYNGAKTEQLDVPKLGSFSEIREILLDSKNRLWLGLEAGLLMFDFQSGQWEDFSKESELSKAAVKVLIEARDGKIWLGNDVSKKPKPASEAEQDAQISAAAKPGKYSIHSFDGQKWTHYPWGTCPNNNTINDILELKDGRLAIAGAGGLCLLKDSEVNKAPLSSRTKQSNISSLSEARDGSLLASQTYFQTGLAVYSAKGDKLSEFPNDEVSKLRILKTAQDPQGRLWIMSTSGAILILPQ